MKVYRIDGTNIIFATREHAARFLGQSGLSHAYARTVAPSDDAVDGVVDAELLSYDANPDECVAAAYAAQYAPTSGDVARA